MGFLIKFWVTLNKIREWLQRKKTLFTGITMVGGGIAAAAPVVMEWSDGKIDLQKAFSELGIQATAISTGFGLIFAAVHPNNVLQQVQNLPSQIGGNEVKGKP